MQYPTLDEQKTSRSSISAFRGYNHNLRIDESEFYDTTNLTADKYPLLSPRKKRGVYASPTSPQGMISKDALCYVDGATFYINGSAVSGLTLSTDASDCPKKLISMGAYVVILPDKKYVNTKDLTDCGSIEATVETTNTVTFSLSKIDGNDYSNDGSAVPADTVAPSNPSNMQLWIDTSSTPHTLKQYSSTSAMWITIPTTYIKISSVGIGTPFEIYDGVTISGVESELLQDLNGTMIIWDKGDDYIVVIGVLDAVTTQSAALTVSRKMPNMDYVIESGNRLWGCRYGTALNGEVVNEIYASKLGDFKNWNSFLGISTDSYAATVGTDGQFTGAIAHLGYPLFFKENCMHKVYGNFPSNYQIQSTVCKGVQTGSSESLAIVNSTLYYKSQSGICAYDGSLPQEMPDVFGDIAYTNATACAHNNKYYINMKNGSTWYLFVYDASKGIWIKEDNVQIDSFCSCGAELYFIDHADNKIKTVCGSGTLEAAAVSWLAETGVIGTDSPDKKYISRLSVRMSLVTGTTVKFFMQYDSSGTWTEVSAMTGTSLRSFSLTLRPKRCDHFKLKITGTGECNIYSVTKTIEEGSDV